MQGNTDSSEEEMEEILGSMQNATEFPSAVKYSTGGNCRVKGCKANLRAQTLTNVRYSICQEHKAAPIILFNGVKKRFCGQCCRFRLIGFFEGEKKTCKQCLEIRSMRRKRRMPPKEQEMPGYSDATPTANFQSFEGTILNSEPEISMPEINSLEQLVFATLGAFLRNSNGGNMQPPNGKQNGHCMPSDDE